MADSTSAVRVVSASLSTETEETCCFYLLDMCFCQFSACLHCFTGELGKNIIGDLTGHTIVVVAAVVLLPIF